jgi:hypothetical protein
LLLLTALILLGGAAGSAHAQLQVSPAAVVLDGPESTQQLLVGLTAGAATKDVTRKSSYSVADPAIARVDGNGLVEPLAEGSTHISIRQGNNIGSVTLRVTGLKNPQPVSFEQQVIPLLTKAACNSGGCHGKAEGQNGFKLSVFGFDPEADHAALTREGRGRRVLASSPGDSLLVQKAVARVPHGGGRKIQEGSLPHRRLMRWMAEGMRDGNGGFVPETRIEVEPERVVLEPGWVQQLRVTAVDAEGKRHCVTAEAEFESNAPNIVGVDGKGGLQAGQNPGEAAILVRHMGNVTVCRVTLPRPGNRFARPPENNQVDRHVWDKLALLGIPPSGLTDDSTFLRRVYLDTIGTLPTAADAREFLVDQGADKRSRVIDRLLERPEYADFWAMKWSDLLRVDRDAIGPQGAVAITRWLRRQFRDNTPYDQFARQIVAARGNSAGETPSAFFKALDNPEALARSVSQLFLGVRIECAQCHHHPSERWGQPDYFGLAGFFTGVGRKQLPTGSVSVVTETGKDLENPRTKKPEPTRALGAAPAKFGEEQDRRDVFADWMTETGNPYFAKAIANRLWAHYFGRGLVEPLDDLRATNPASNEPLLEELADRLKGARYDLKVFTRLLLNSRAYQLAGATDANRADEQNFSHALPKAMAAEVLLDAICQVTGTPEKYPGLPEGTRAVQLWDNRMPSYFLRLFGRPVRASVCECERGNEPSIAQALHLMNAPEINDKIRARGGVARRLADGKGGEDAVVLELYLTCLARPPRPEEKAAMGALFSQAGKDRRGAVEDALWALMNTREFVYNH